MIPLLDYAGFRERARALLSAGTTPEDATWDAKGSSASLFEAATTRPGARQRIPRDLASLLEAVSCHADPSRWALMYRVLWRVTHNERDLLEDAADADVARMRRMERAVSQEVHKMHAFVRFRETGEDGDRLYVAWFEPEHDVLKRAAPFFVDRFASMRWLIATPELAARWDGRRLDFVPGPHARPSVGDRTESLWRTYYANTFNPARLNERLMAKEMPRRYWKNLPEAADIARLAADARPRVTRMPGQSDAPMWASKIGAHVPSTTVLDDCRRCPLWQRATQAVAGEGPPDALVMLVGEQPGDEEDLQGRPFVGPAGKLLDRALEEAGVDRSRLYLTNAVKHFKWEATALPRGKRRIHKTPAQQEIDACHYWLDEEIGRVRPQVIVALGATAAASLTGARAAIGTLRGRSLSHASGARIVVTYHPSAVLRARDDAKSLYEALRADLRQACSR